MSATPSDVNGRRLADNPRSEESSSPEVKIASIVFILVLIFFFLCLYVYIKSRARLTATASRRRPLVFGSGDAPNGAGTRHGLAASILDSLPITLYRSEDYKDEGGLECAVCLSDLVDGEKVRVLPGCKHGFHLDCIDMWFHSHSTCPLCRTAVTDTPDCTIDIERPAEPVNRAVVMQADSGEPSSSSGKQAGAGALAVEIPHRPAVGLAFSSPTTGDRHGKSPAVLTPTSARRRSFRRILIREPKVPGSSNSPRLLGDGELRNGWENGDGI